ncbi:hypothetical protein LGN81_10305, partial [Escherichia coli]|uniref:hypothetical protein n=1 Tax=Escherichia coli TaxID=562 RepID=UPI001CF4DF8B
KSAQIREILINESAWEEMTCLFAPSLGSMTVLIIILRLSSNYCPSIYAAFIISTLPIKRVLSR